MSLDMRRRELSSPRAHCGQAPLSLHFVCFKESVGMRLTGANFSLESTVEGANPVPVLTLAFVLDPAAESTGGGWATLGVGMAIGRGRA